MLNEIFLNFIYLFHFLFLSSVFLKTFEKIFKVENSKGENILKASLIFSIAIAVSPLFTGESYGLFWDLAFIWIYSILAFILLIIGHIIVDNIVFHRVNNLKEIKDGNLALAITEGANFIATGLIIGTIIDNVFSIEINHLQFWLKLFSIYLAIQFLLALSLFIYEIYLKIFKKIDIKKLIYNGNISSAIHISSNYIIVSFLLATAFVLGRNTFETILLTTGYFLISLIFIELIRILVDFLLIRDIKLSELIKNDNYFRILYIETFVISIIFIYHFLQS
jgi:hypothetical protein